MGCCAPASPAVQLTWMDAKVGDRVVTPRIGKPVEINALWLNALAIMARSRGPSCATRDREADCASAACTRQRELRAAFWNEERGYLYDVDRRSEADGARPHRDASLRPNQIFAVSLPYISLLAGAEARRRRCAVRREL